MKKIFILILFLANLSQAFDFKVIDVRTPEEYAQDHVNQAENVDFLSPKFEVELLKLDKSIKYKIYCQSGRRSGQALKTMKKLGFKFVEDLGAFTNAKLKLKNEK